MAKYNVLILGASYGSLLATKLLLCGHSVKLACLPSEAELINSEGTLVRLPVKTIGETVEIYSNGLPGKLSADSPDKIDPTEFDLVALAMQEPQYRTSGARELLKAVGQAKVPCMSIMNMPPLPYLKRVSGLAVSELEHCYADSAVWDDCAPDLMTLASPDPQAFRPPEEKPNILQVGLPTNFKVAAFHNSAHTAILRNLEADIMSIRFTTSKGEVELPVKLKVHDSIFVPFAKWPMLISGNYRCIGENEKRPIKEAVHSDLETSKTIYNWVCELCKKLGARRDDMVPFEKYANAALGLLKPSSAARGLFAGAPYIERVDKLVQSIAAQHGLRSNVVDEIVRRVDARSKSNRASKSA
ncbi:MAG: hypothetical protein OXN84_05075 [Albidovulum sp.]|nr:hypothetical protein [Albidovulum sp.]